MIDIYSTRTMLKAINLVKPVYTFFRDTFFSSVETSPNEKIDVDFKKGKRKMAPFVAPRIGGIVMDRQGFTTTTYKVPKIAPERIITADDLKNRSMGESIYSTRTPSERAQEFLAQDLLDLDDMITRREEWMCREVMLNGKVLMSGEGFEQQVDFGFTNKETLVGAALWSTDTSDPIEDLKRWRLSIIQKTGQSPNIVVMASNVVSRFIKHPVVQKLLDVARLNIGAIEPTVQSPALTFVGKLPSLGLEVYSYDEWFLNDAGTETAMVPDNTVIIGTKGVNKRLYGALTQSENGEFVTIEGQRIPKSWFNEDDEVRKVRLASRPLPVPDDIDGWYVAIVM